MTRHGCFYKLENEMNKPLTLRRSFLRSFFFVLMAALFCAAPMCEKEGKKIDGLKVLHQLPLKWTKLDKGLDSTSLVFERKNSDKIKPAVLRIDPQKYEFLLLRAPELLGRPSGEIKEMAIKAKVLAAINGSFYLPETFEPIGLVVSRGQVVHPWHRNAGSGLFIQTGVKADIVWSRHYNKDWEKAAFALQAGPLLVEPDEKEGIYEKRNKHRHRSALGIDEQGRVLMLCTLKEDNGESFFGLDLYELMKIMMAPPEEGGLGAKRALNLDGGASSSFYVNHADLTLHVPATNEIRNGIAIRKRN